MPALDIVEKEWRASHTAASKSGDKKGAHGALIISGKVDQDKFFSNGKLFLPFRLHWITYAGTYLGLDFAAVLKKPSFHTSGSDFLAFSSFTHHSIRHIQPVPLETTTLPHSNNSRN